MTALHAMTFNIRLETQEPDPADNWEARREPVASFLSSSGADVIGLQEVRPSQLTFLSETLAKAGYSHVGAGRDADGGGEASPIFYKNDCFELVREQTRWLSGTPLVPGSKLRGAGCPRVVTCAELRRRSNDERLFVFCAHLDHHGMAKGKLFGSLPIQAAQAEILLQEVRQFCLVDHYAQIILGDFNSWRSAGAPPVFLREGYKDASCCGDGNVDDQPTFTGFKSGSYLRLAVERAIAEHIDWIFVSSSARTSNYNVHTSQYVNTEGQLRCLSDHLAISSLIHTGESGLVSDS